MIEFNKDLFHLYIFLRGYVKWWMKIYKYESYQTLYDMIPYIVESISQLDDPSHGKDSLSQKSKIEESVVRLITRNLFTVDQVGGKSGPRTYDHVMKLLDDELFKKDNSYVRYIVKTIIGALQQDSPDDQQVWIKTICSKIIEKLHTAHYKHWKFDTPSYRFESAIFDMFKQGIPSEHDIKVFLFRSIPRHMDLSIFGSSVFDFGKSRDLDVTGDEKHLELLKSSLECFFELVSVPKQKFNYGVDCAADKQIGTYVCRYSLLGWVGPRVGPTVRSIPGEIETMQVHLDLVPSSVIESSTKNHLYPAFFEETLIKTAYGVSIRKPFSDHPLKNLVFLAPDVCDLLQNVSKKVLTPIPVSFQRDLRYHHDHKKHVCDRDNLCKIQTIVQRLKHINRYVEKSRIYHIDGEKMPFMQNVVFCTTTEIKAILSKLPKIIGDVRDQILSYIVLPGDDDLCYFCGESLTQNLDLHQRDYFVRYLKVDKGPKVEDVEDKKTEPGKNGVIAIHSTPRKNVSYDYFHGSCLAYELCEAARTTKGQTGRLLSAQATFEYICTMLKSFCCTEDSEV